MKNLIYQIWDGELRPACKYSSKLMKAYADKIGADYRLDLSPNIASKLVDKDGMYFEWLNPILDDSFLEYDNVVVVDLDIFPTANCSKNIFEESYSDVGICTEPFQGKYRASTIVGGIGMANDEKWSRAVKKRYEIDLPRDADNYLKVYNAGMVLFSNKGIQKCREKFEPFQEYMNYMRTIFKPPAGRFYVVDQNYFHVMMCKYLDYTEMNNGWNSYIHYVRGPLALQDDINDSRNEFTEFVHIQLSSGDYFEDDKIHRIVNLPRSKWNL